MPGTLNDDLENPPLPSPQLCGCGCGSSRMDSPTLLASQQCACGCGNRLSDNLPGVFWFGGVGTKKFFYHKCFLHKKSKIPPALCDCGCGKRLDEEAPDGTMRVGWMDNTKIIRKECLSKRDWYR